MTLMYTCFCFYIVCRMCFSMTFTSMAGLLVVNAFLTHVMCLLLDQAYKVCEQDKLIIAIHSGLRDLLYFF